MNEQLAQHINEIMEWVRASKDFAAVQAPLVCEDIVRWGIVQCIGGGLLFAFLAAASARLTWWAGRKFAKAIDKFDTTGDEFAPMLPCLLMALSGIGTFTFAITSLEYISCNLLAIVAPRLYILDYLKDFI